MLQTRCRCRELARAVDSIGRGGVELVRSPSFTGSAGLQPLGAYNNPLSVQWLDAVGTHSAELRLALALAGTHGTKRVQGRRQSDSSIVWNPADPVRRHFMPLDTNDRWAPSKFNVAGERLVSDSSVVCVANDLQRDAVRLLRRRLVIASQNGDEYFPLTGVPGTEASLTDILALIRHPNPLFEKPYSGPIAIGYGSHFGLGVLGAE